MFEKDNSPNRYLKAQWQMWDILLGVSSLGVKFIIKILACYDKKFSRQDRHFAKRDRMPLLSLNELGQKSVNLTILGKSVKKP